MKILIVEDDDVQAEKIALFLQNNFQVDIHISWAMSLKKAKEVIAKKKFDLFFLDGDLGGDDRGFNLIPLIKEYNNSSKIIMCSSVPAFNESGMKMGADHFIEKDRLVSTQDQDVVFQLKDFFHI